MIVQKQPTIKSKKQPTTRPKLNLNFLKNIHPSKNIIFIIITIIILITGTLVILDLGGEQPSKTTTSSTELTLAAIKTTVQPGESISFSRKIHNLESYELTISYFLTNKYNDIIKTEYETINHLTPTKKEIPIPEELPLGTYTLNAETTYNNQQLTYSIPIKIYQQTDSSQETCFDNMKNQDETEIDCGGVCEPCEQCPSSCDDNDECTFDECSSKTNYQCIYTEIGGCQTPPQQQSPSPSTQYREGEVTLDSIRVELTNKINSNPEEAAQLCGEVTEIIEQSLCFKTVAQLTKENKYCNYIIRQQSKDSCYMYFVLHLNETQHCDIIQDNYLKSSCESIKEIKRLESQYTPPE